MFGQDLILNTCHKANQELIKKRRQDLINKENKQENHNKKEHTYIKEDKVLRKNVWNFKFNQDVKSISGSYVIRALRNNGTVKACKG